MTTLALQSLSFSTKILEKVLGLVKNTFKGMMIGYMIARQTQANRHIAEQLCRYGEYRHDEYWNLLSDLNQKTIQDIQEEFGR